MFLEWLLVAGLAIGAVLLLSREGVTQRADFAIYDALLSRRPAISSDLIIVAIDEPSLAAIGIWPWPRDVHAALLRRLAAARPAAIGYDVLFVEPGPPAADAALAAAVKAAGNVVLPMTFTVPGPNGAPFAPQLPIPAVGRAARAVGHADFVADYDGILRRVSLAAGDAAQHWTQFGEQIYRIVAGHPSRAFDRSARGALPADRLTLAAPVMIPYSGGAGHHRAISLVSVLRGEVPDELLRGHVVLIGSTASGSGDQYPMPAGAMPGVEIQANVIDGLLANRTIAEAGPAARAAFTFVPLAILLVALLFLSPGINVALGVGLIVATLASSTLLLFGRDLWIPPAAGLAGLMIIYPLWAWRRLEAANAYMLTELKQLRAEPDLVPARTIEPRRARYQEPIAQQMGLLHLAIGRVRDLRSFFSDSLKGLPDATLILGRDGRVIVANRVAEQLFAEIDLQSGDETAPNLDALLTYLAPTARNATDDDAEREIATADGRTFVLRTAPLLDATGQQAGTIARLTDITAIRLVTRQREDALRLLTHDMRSPQAAILALLDQPPPSETVLRERIANHARRTLALADDFVLLARAEAMTVDEEVLDLGALLTEAADDQWELARSRNIRIDVPYAEIEYLVRGDRSLLTRMFGNLIGNAVKYSGRDTHIVCTIVGAAAAGSGGEPSSHVCRIVDQGIGIAADQIARIFDPFHRSAAGREDDPGGSGLGLAFVKAVVERHSGTIVCTSEPGIGSTFTVSLPAVFEE